MSRPADIGWLAVDWGSSHARVWAMRDFEIVAETTCAHGAAALAPEGFEPCLLEAVTHWLPTRGALPALVCGMAGARNRWREAPYLPTPCAPYEAAQHLTRVTTAESRLNVRIVPGICQSAPQDVMRGEETQLAGFLSTRPRFSGVVCLPGTHSKWVRLKNGKITAFTTYMTGELYALCVQSSILPSSVAPVDWDGSAFAAGVAATLADPAQISAQLFSLRAENLLLDLPETSARARLSGYWIGLELAATRSLWQQPTQLTLIGANPLCAHYQAALSQQQIQCQVFSGAAMSVAGLCAIATHAGLTK